MNENGVEIIAGQRSWSRYDPYTGVRTYGPVSMAEGSYLQNVRQVTKPDPRPKPKGWLFPTPYTFEQQRTQYPYGKCVQGSFGYEDRYVGALYGVSSGNGAGNLAPGGDVSKARPWPNVDHVSQAEVKALNQFLTNGKAQDGTFNLGVAWGERKETADLLNHAAKTCLNVLEKLHKNRPIEAFRELFPNGSRKDFELLKETPYWQWYKRNAKTTAKALPKHVASAFLSLQNGWKPFLNDVSNAAESLANRNLPAYWVVTGKGFFKKQLTDTVIVSTFPDINNRGDALHEWVSVTSVFSRIDATVSDDYLHTLAQLGVTNPLSMLWDLTRLTYVFDYFVAVGDWLRSLEAALGMRFYSGSVTRYASYSTMLRSLEHSDTVEFFGEERWVKWDRAPYTGFPFPIAPLSLKPGKLNLLQFGNIAALAYTYLTGGRPTDERG